jgi:hypothetical protein
VRKTRAFVLLLVVGSLAGFALGDDARIPTADRALLARIMAETSASQSPSQASFSAYVSDVAIAVSNLIGRRLRSFAGMLPGAHYLRYLAWLLLASMAALVAWVGFQELRRPRPKRRTSKGTSQEVLVPARQSGDPNFWLERVRTLLREGEVANALVALWLYLAHAIGTGDVDPSWTIRELLERRGRRDLVALGRRLERFMYGPLPPAAADVSALLSEMEEALP